jgi:hypothetical protein
MVGACHTEAGRQLTVRTQPKSGFDRRNNVMVEAAGIEPLFPLNPNPTMANDFGFYRVKTFELP